MSTSAAAVLQFEGVVHFEGSPLGAHRGHDRGRPVVALASRPDYVRRRLAVMLVVALVLAVVGLLAADHLAPNSVLSNSVLSNSVADGSANQLAAGAPGLDPASGVGGAAVSNDAAPGVRPAGVLAGSAGSYVVQPGDTVWSIARALAHGGSVPRLVQQISDANGGVDLVVGQRLTLP